MEVSSKILIGAQFFITHDFNDRDKKKSTKYYNNEKTNWLK